MDVNSHHIIEKQVIRITLPDIAAAMEWEVNERQGFIKMVQTQLESCFDEYIKSDDYLIIENLNLDLGDFTLKNLNEELPRRLDKEFHRKLEEQHSTLVKKKIIGENYPGHSNFPEEQTEEKDRLFNDQAARLQSLCIYLNYGYLPWWASGGTNWDTNWIQALSENEMSNFRSFLSGNQDSLLLRLASEFEDSFLEQLLNRLGIPIKTGEAWLWLKKALENMQLPGIGVAGIKPEYESSDSIPQRLISMPLLRRQYWFYWLKSALGKSEIPGIRHLFAGHRDILNRLGLMMQPNSEYHNPIVSDGTVPGMWKDELEQMIKTSSDTLVPEAGNRFLKTGSAPGEEISFTDFQSEAGNGIKKTESADQEEHFYVNEAGVILLHPFLPQLFRTCSWLHEDNTWTGTGKTRAVYALYYLATGKAIAYEHQLLLPKLLLGIRWENPLEPTELLNDSEKNACDELLIAVVNHWKALRNTSPDGLREGYLRRTGKLERAQGGWCLVVEHKTQDILLSHIPWSISNIKYSWMEDMLTILWE